VIRGKVPKKINRQSVLIDAGKGEKVW